MVRKLAFKCQITILFFKFQFGNKKLIFKKSINIGSLFGGLPKL
jgi:hypothetical protein